MTNTVAGSKVRPQNETGVSPPTPAMRGGCKNQKL